MNANHHSWVRTEPVLRALGLLAAIVFLLCFTPWAASGASVYGTAWSPNGKVAARMEFKIFGPQGEVLKSVTTDAAGRYGVFLKPGLYRVRLGPTWEATLQSLAEPSQQDIRFRIRGQ